MTTNHEVQHVEDGLDVSRRFAKQQFQCTLAMLLSAALAFVLTGVVADESAVLGLSIAAAMGLTVGVWCQKDAYRQRNGSLTLALLLIAGMWVVPLIVLMTSYFG